MKKLSLANAKQLNKNEMKKIMAGSGNGGGQSCITDFDCELANPGSHYCCYSNITNTHGTNTPGTCKYCN